MKFFPLYPALGPELITSISAALPDYDILPFVHLRPLVVISSKILTFEDNGHSVETSLLELAELRATIHFFLPPHLADPILQSLPKHKLNDHTLVYFFFYFFKLIKTATPDKAIYFENWIKNFCKMHKIKARDLPISRLMFWLVVGKTTYTLQWLEGLHPDFSSCFANKDEVGHILVHYILEPSELSHFIFNYLKTKKLEHVLLLQDKKERNYLEYLLMDTPTISIVEELLRHNLGQDLFTFFALSTLRGIYFSCFFDAKSRQQYDQLCKIANAQLIKNGAIKKTPRLADGLKTSVTDPCAFLFGEGATLAPSCTTKEDLLKTALCVLFNFLHNPPCCFPILKFLNQEFVRYCRESGQEIFKLDRNTYKFVEIDGLFYPSSKSNYKMDSHKNSMLQKFLISFLRGHGLAEHCVQWVGFVPSITANKHVERGDFVTENRLGDGLFHNKLAHMFHYAILVCLIDARLISTRSESGESITVLDILMNLVRTAFSSRLPWSSIFDQRWTDRIIFTDPHRLCSVIMHDADQLETREIADYMIDSFCKGTDHLHNAFGGKKILSKDEFLAKFNDIQVHTFVNRRFLFSKAQTNNDRKKLTCLTNVGVLSDAGVYEKKYEVNSAFEVKKFGS